MKKLIELIKINEKGMGKIIANSEKKEILKLKSRDGHRYTEHLLREVGGSVKRYEHRFSPFTYNNAYPLEVEELIMKSLNDFAFAKEAYRKDMKKLEKNGVDISNFPLELKYLEAQN